MATTTQPAVSQSERAMAVLAGSLPLGCLVIVLYAAQASNMGQYASVVGVALAVACCALVMGGLLGFLFGVPRTLQQEAKQAARPNGDAAEGGPGSSQEVTYGVNTNLEQISDWLTKILVGVGLTELVNLPAALRIYADSVGAGLGGFANSGVFAIALFLYFVVAGFLMSYLWTRLYFAAALRQADATSRLVAVESKLDIIDLDAKAWSLTQRLLNPAPGSAPPSQAEVNAAIGPATSNMKAQIFWAAKDVRTENWRNFADKPKMERTIPIFRALIVSDTERVYHANHGQLGFALKDQRNPDWPSARLELTEAIRLRGNWQTSGWAPFYEFVRATCSINLDEAFKSGQASDDKTKALIRSDLHIAFSEPETKQLAMDDPDIKKWLELNGTTARDCLEQRSKPDDRTVQSLRAPGAL